MHRFYTLLLRLALPALLLHYQWRYRTQRLSVRPLLALGVAERTDQPLWLHAASMGEVQALAGLVHRIVESGIGPVLVTVGTPTGFARARELYAGLPGVEVRQAPWDLPGAARRFLDAVRPRMAVFIETELWPNLCEACHARDVPLVLVSARLSARSLGRYRRFAQHMMGSVVRNFAAISVQTDADRERFIALGAAPERVTLGGDLKFDLPLPPDIEMAGTRLRRRWAEARPLWVAGSTHEGEEAICLAAQRELAALARAGGRESPLLVLAPRRPERFAAVAGWLESQSTQFARVSGGEVEATALQVLLLDTTGVLLSWYAAADAAFVGGSLVPVGGHNLLEPAALGKPVIAGPHTFNSPEPARRLTAAGALDSVANAAQLAAVLDRHFRDVAAARACGARAAAMVQANRGAAGRAAGLIAALVREGLTAPGPRSAGD